MMSNKCKICDKTVYPMDQQINLDGSAFHKPCAKCSDCQSQITLANFTKNESGDHTLLLCKTHYFARFNKGEGYAGGDKFNGKTKEATGKMSGSPLTTNKQMTGCKICSKSVYPVDPQINLDGSLFHKTCAKCADCSCQIGLDNFAAVNSPEEFILLCKTHYSKRFSETGGSYPGGDKYAVKNTRDVNASAVSAAAKDPVRTASFTKEKSFDFASKTTRGSLSKTSSDVTLQGDGEDVGPISVEE